jgi:hypothetical protein
MTQTQFLLLLISIIPFINALTIKICEDSPKLVATFNKVFPLLFLINLVGIYGNLDRDNSYLVITEAARGISLGFDIDRLALGFLFLLNFFWIVFVFYSQRFLHLIQARNIQSLKIFFTLIIAFVNLIIISKNLLSILFFYNCLIILCHFFSIKFLHKTETKFSNFFTFLLYFESIFFFLAIVATYKFTGQIDFIEGGIISEVNDRLAAVGSVPGDVSWLSDGKAACRLWASRWTMITPVTNIPATIIPLTLIPLMSVLAI